ncbi:MAG TPA: glycosyltransferase family 2 protein [Roseiflexaceae bacterium]|nr:glycosyltransferase family 2 protein [Roseiflexaceae bacterium]
MGAWILGSVVAYSVATWVQAARRGLRARRAVPDRQESQTATWPRVSVLVPAWNERGTLEGSLATLRGVVYPDWEIIVIAGGPDGTFPAAQKLAETIPHMRVLEQQPGGKSAALAAGLKAATGDVVVALDADSHVGPQWLRELVLPLMGGAAASTGNYVPLRTTPISRQAEVDKLASYEITKIVTLQGSGSIAIWRWALEQAGGFLEQGRYGADDWDLDARLLHRHLPRQYAQRAVVRTERPATWREWWQNELRWRRAHLRWMWVSRRMLAGDRRAAGRNLFPYVFAWGSVAALVVLACGAWRRVFGMGQTFAWILAAFVSWLLLRPLGSVCAVIAYTRSASWIRVAWVRPILALLEIVAACIASLTFWRARVNFKGPRSQASSLPAQAAQTQLNDTVSHRK